MSNVVPFPIHEYGARPHQTTPQATDRRTYPRVVENEAGIVVEHVRDGKALTPKGRALLEEFARRIS